MKIATKERIVDLGESIFGNAVAEGLRKVLDVEDAGNLYIPEKENKQPGAQRVYNAKAALEEKTEICRLDTNRAFQELGTVRCSHAEYWMERNIYEDFAAISSLVNSSAVLTGEQRQIVERSIRDITLTASSDAQRLSTRFAIAAYINSCKGD